MIALQGEDVVTRIVMKLSKCVFTEAMRDHLASEFTAHHMPDEEKAERLILFGSLSKFPAS